MSSYFTTIFVFMISLALVMNLMCDGTVCSSAQNRLEQISNNLNSLDSFTGAFVSDPAFWGAVTVIAITGLITSNIFLTVVAPFVLIIADFAIPVRDILNSVADQSGDPNVAAIAQAIRLVFLGLLFIATMQLFVGRGDV